MKAFFTSIIMLLASIGHAQSQWCTPTVDVANSGGSGIQRVTLDAMPPIERVSPTTEGYALTGYSTSLAKGTSYTLGVTKVSGINCSDNSVRVYLDYNRDFDFDDAAELVGVMNYADDDEDEFTVVVPNWAVEGPTRLRVVEKLIPECGVGPIDPCGIDTVVGSHRGEIEDYNVVITAVNALPEWTENSSFNVQVLDHQLSLIGQHASASPIGVDLFDLNGRTILSRELGMMAAGPVRIALGPVERDGVYVARITTASTVVAIPILVR